MARGRPVAGTARGGELVPPLRPTLIVASLACSGAAGTIAVLAAGSRSGTAGVLAAIGLILLGGSLLLRRAAFVGPALAFTGAAYAVAVAGHGSVDALAVLFAPALLLAGELGYWSLETATVAREDAAVTLRRASTVAAVALLASAVAAFLVASSNLEVGGGIALVAAGVAAATGVLALVARLARRSARRV